MEIAKNRSHKKMFYIINMRIIVFFLIIFIAAGYIGSQLKNVTRPFVLAYFSWAFILVLFNLLIGIFLYSFRHSILNTSGQPGLKGKMGIRGEEGTPGYCDFCLTKDELDKQNKYKKLKTETDAGTEPESDVGTETEPDAGTETDSAL